MARRGDFRSSAFAATNFRPLNTASSRPVPRDRDKLLQCKHTILRKSRSTWPNAAPRQTLRYTFLLQNKYKLSIDFVQKYRISYELYEKKNHRDMIVDDMNTEKDEPIDTNTRN